MSVIWNVIGMERDLPDGNTPPLGTVTSIHWSAKLTEVGNDGTVFLGPPDPNNYIPFSDITEAQAIQWAKDALGPETVSEIEADLATAEQSALNPTKGYDVPWQP